MIKLPKLDDQNYADIVNSARSKIPKLLPEWTDFNVHDPGITLIELLSWLKEMQQYHLDQITVRNKLKFLKLLGCVPRHMKPAEAGIVIDNEGCSFTLVPGSRFFAGEVVFEAEQKLRLSENRIKKLLVYDGSTFTDISRIQNELDMPAYAFGEGQAAGSSLYIGFDREFEAEQLYRLWISVYDGYPVRRNPAEDGSMPEICRVAWELLKDGEWTAIERITDNTNGMLCSGYLEFTHDFKMEAGCIEGCQDELYWLRARLEKPGCEESPKLLRIYRSYISARQTETLSEIHEFELTEGANSICIGTWLSLFGEIELQLETPSGGWRFIAGEEVSLSMERDFAGGVCQLRINYKSNGSSESKSKGRIRVLCRDRDFLRDRIIGSSNGLPHQKLSFKNIGRLLREKTVVQVAEKDPQYGTVFYDWSFTDDINVRGGCDRVLSIDAGRQELCFGDNENGLIPAAGEDNIIYAACCITEGLNGNTNSYEINEIFDYSMCTGGVEEGLGIFNFSDCTGGRDEEVPEAAMTRLRRELGIPSRAVTAEDFEYLVRTTPGLRIADVKAVPQIGQGNMNITIIAIPYSTGMRPRPDREYMEVILKRLEKFRLVGSTISMVEPQYVEISVYAEVVPGVYSDGLDREILQRLNDYFGRTEQGGNNNRLGEPVFESDIISFINSIDNVGYVKRVSLSARGNGWSRSPGGDIHIPFNSVVCPGTHEISLQEF